METHRWHCSWPAIGLASIAIPPAGWLLFTARPGIRAGWKILALLPMLALTAAHLYFVWGLRIEMRGNGQVAVVRPNLDQHYSEIESDRATDQGKITPPEPSTPAVVQAAETPQPAASPAAAPEKTPAAVPSASVYRWSDFRGPRRDGHYTEMPIRTEWPELGLPEVWRKPVGGGYASMIVADGMVYTIEQRRDQEVIAAYDLKTGRQVWQNAWAAFFRESMGGDGPRSTPTWHEGRIYVQGAEGELRCLDAATGKVFWSKNILKDNGASNLTWGMAASPLLVDGKVIVQPGGSGGRSVVAYDQMTGERVWQALDDKAAYASPHLANLGGEPQILVFTAQRLVSLTVADGRLLWEFPWTTAYDVNSAQPIVVDDHRVIVSSGYDHGAALLDIARQGDRWQVRQVWVNRNMKNKFNSSVLSEGYVYGLDEGILACIDASTGERKWKGGRYGFGQVLLASGHLVISTESGEVVLVKASPERLIEVARFPALEGKTWNVPALAGGYLLVRNETEMVCYRVGKS